MKTQWFYQDEASPPIPLMKHENFFEVFFSAIDFLHEDVEQASNSPYLTQLNFFLWVTQR